MDQNQLNSQPEEDETGLAGLVVPAPADLDASKTATAEPPLRYVDPLAADRANRIAAIRAEAAAKEAELAAQGKTIREPPQVSAALLAKAEERAATEARANSPFKVSSNPADITTSWEEVVAKRQEDARQRRHQKELDERAANQQHKEDFKARILAARQPETTVHRPQPIAPAISAQTRAEMEAGRKRSEEFGRTQGVTIMPRVQ